MSFITEVLTRLSSSSSSTSTDAAYRHEDGYLSSKWKLRRDNNAPNREVCHDMWTRIFLGITY